MITGRSVSALDRKLVVAAFAAMCSITAPPALAQGGAPAVVVVDATQGPMPPAKQSAARAKQAGANAIRVKLENISQLHDPELIPLIEREVNEMLAKHGFSARQVTFERCPLACPR